MILSKKYCVIYLFLLSYLSLLGASKNTEVDSISYIYPEIKVSAERILSNSALQFSPNSIIHKAQIEKTAALQASELLNNIPGLYIKDLGGLNGLKTISLRGTSAQQTLIMIDGMRLNSMQNGITDLSTIPIAMFEDIEVVRGGASAVFGGNSIGGVINFRTKSNIVEFSGSP